MKLSSGASSQLRRMSATTSPRFLRVPRQLPHRRHHRLGVSRRRVVPVRQRRAREACRVLPRAASHSPMHAV